MLKSIAHRKTSQALECRMRTGLLSVVAISLFAQPASAQTDLSGQTAAAIQMCVAGGSTQQFCECYVNTWIGLLSQVDIQLIWGQNPSSRAHFQQMESVAKQRCGG